MNISFRKISNGFLASAGNDYILGHNGSETFYPSLEALIGDADSLFRQAVENEENTRKACLNQAQAQQRLGGQQIANAAYFGDQQAANGISKAR